MKTSSAILFTLLAAAVMTGGCDLGKKKAAPPPAQPPRTSWTPQEIAADPAGYLRWSDQQIVQQIAAIERKLQDLAGRRSELEAKRKTLEDNIADVENIHRRLSEAYQRADDEDRWPLKFADRTFTRQKATEIIEQTRKYAEDRKPLDQTYRQLFDRMDGMAANLRGEITKLKTLRDRLALDMEEVRINQGMADMDKLSQTAAQLGATSKAVAALADEDPMKLAAPREPASRINVDDMLK